jgi:hypothetical protein
MHIRPRVSGAGTKVDVNSFLTPTCLKVKTKESLFEDGSWRVTEHSYKESSGKLLELLGL